MRAYVIKSWAADTTPVDDEGSYVRIVGRAPGIISWLLAALGIDPTVTMRATATKIVYEVGSLSGRSRRIIPLAKISSLHYGYLKPWISALALAVFLSFLLGAIGVTMQPDSSVAIIAVAILVSFVIAIVYYLLNKQLTVGIVEVGGVGSAITFKRSIIENKKINESEAEHVCKLIEALMFREEKQAPQ